MDEFDFIAHAGDLTVNELSHHGVKGMKWGEHKSVHVSSNDVKAARARHNSNVDALHAHAAALSLATSTREKQKHLNAIHDIANKTLNSGDIERAHRLTTGEKVLSGVAGSIVATPGVGTAAGLAGAHLYNKSLAKQSRAQVTQYANSTLKDYH